MRLKNGTILYDDFIFKNGDLSLSNGKIFFDTSDDDKILDCTGCYIVPGLVDIHAHGALGFDALDGTEESLEKISAYMAENGVTTFLANLMTQSHDVMKKAAKTVKKVYDKGTGGANIGGIYMEGPYFSEKYKGAQNPAHLRFPSCDEFDILNSASGNLVKIISLAPELPGAIDFIKAKNDIVNIAIGHTDSDYQQASEAILAGASVLTHSFNGMRGLHHRNPNAIGAATDGGIFCECISDGFHLAPSIVRLLYKACGCDKLILISDNIRPAGLKDGISTSGGLKVIIKDGTARLEDGTIAGSTTSLFDCVKKAIAFGISPEHAFKAATQNPSKAAGIDYLIGSITWGKRADLLILNKDWSIKHVIIGGQFYR